MMRAMRRSRRWRSALGFVAPLLVLLALWAAVIPAFHVSPRVFPDVGAVAVAGLESMRDGSLARHVGMSFLRVAVGTAIAIVASIPLGVLMSVSPIVAGILTPLF